jgi:Zn-dependent peptidase ImmA (M78 family)
MTSAEAAAEAARRELGVGVDGPIHDLLRVLEDGAGLRVFVVALPDGGIDGAYQQDRGEPFILVNQEHHPTRKRFTLAHEFGHHYLGHGAQLDSSIKLSDRSRKEVEANQFAGSLLMPRPAVDAWLARQGDPPCDLEVLVRLAVFFNVSSWVARYRLDSAGRLSAGAKRKLDEALKHGEHLTCTKQLGLIRPHDSLQAEHERGGYVPARMQAGIADLVDRGLLDRETAAARLRLSRQAAAARIEQLLDPASISD